jgi:putative protein-disulfide isomerase
VKQEHPVQEPQRPKHQPKNQNNSINAGQVKIDFYTDPLCCWSWAFDQHWKKLLHEYGDVIEYRYIMCGMIQDWHTYNDPMNSVFKPIQMGPVWMHASEVTQVKMKYSIWHEDPPASSYPACISVKTVGLQSKIAEDQYLFTIRKALMEEGANISKPEILFSLAEKLQHPEFNFQQFKNDWQLGKGKDAFRSDLQKAKFHNIGRFPTLTLQNTKGKGIIAVGYRPYEVLKQAFMQVKEMKEENYSVSN